VPATGNIHLQIGPVHGLTALLLFHDQMDPMNIKGENRKFWDRIAKRYDRVTIWLTRNYPALIQRIVNDVDGAENVLEVATGTGLIAIELARNAGMIEAIDFSSEMIEFAKKKASRDHIENVRFSVQSAYSLEFEDSRFDVAVCSNALHCVHNPEKALSEIRRVLKNKGILIAPTFCHGANWRSRLLSRIMSLTGFKSYRRFKIAEFFDLITSGGFRIIKKDISDDFIPLAYVVAQSVSL
jgi:phosphatidylethanolamine/phosphatidyl-N-methylethanolamine N-methyltransferase